MDLLFFLLHCNILVWSNLDNTILWYLVSHRENSFSCQHHTIVITVCFRFINAYKTSLITVAPFDFSGIVLCGRRIASNQSEMLYCNGSEWIRKYVVQYLMRSINGSNFACVCSISLTVNVVNLLASPSLIQRGLKQRYNYLRIYFLWLTSKLLSANITAI